MVDLTNFVGKINIPVDFFNENPQEVMNTFAFAQFAPFSANINPVRRVIEYIGVCPDFEEITALHTNKCPEYIISTRYDRWSLKITGAQVIPVKQSIVIPDKKL